MYSFAEWCKDNDKVEFLERWDYKKNLKTPEEVAYRSAKKIILKCPRNLHDSEGFVVNSLTADRQSKSNGECRKCKSFGQWCLDNKKEFLLELWDIELNNKNPFDIGASSSDKFYFKCKNKNCNHSSEKKMISTITRKNYFECNQCNSFGQWVINNFGEQYFNNIWDNKSNQISPFEISKCSKNKVYLKCENKEYHDIYPVSCNDFVNGCRCPSCGKKKVHKLDSFGQWCLDNISEDFIEKYYPKDNEYDAFSISKNSLKTIKIKCEKGHQYDTKPNIFIYGSRCPYCSHHRILKEDSLGYLFPEVIEIWSNKNEKTPYELAPNSNQRVVFKCRCGKHEDYEQEVYNAKKSEFMCPRCIREMSVSKLQEKVEKFLIAKGYELKFEHNISLKVYNPKTNRQMPYDIEIPELKLIIEIHGIQHYQVTYFHTLQAKVHGTTPEIEFKEQQKRDKIKKDYAISKKYNFLEIPYWTEKDESYKQLINETINNIIVFETVETAG